MQLRLGQSIIKLVFKQVTFGDTTETHVAIYYRGDEDNILADCDRLLGYMREQQFDEADLNEFSIEELYVFAYYEYAGRGNEKCHLNEFAKSEGSWTKYWVEREERDGFDQNGVSTEWPHHFSDGIEAFEYLQDKFRMPKLWFAEWFKNYDLHPSHYTDERYGASHP